MTVVRLTYDEAKAQVLEASQRLMGHDEMVAYCNRKELEARIVAVACRRNGGHTDHWEEEVCKWKARRQAFEAQMLAKLL